MITKIYTEKIPYFSGAEYMQVQPASTEIKLFQEDITSEEPTHGHDDIEFVLVLKGCGTLTINGIPHTLTAGTMAHLLPYHIHSIKPNKKELLHIFRCRYSLGTLMTFSLTHRAQQKDKYIFEFGSPVIPCDKHEFNILVNNFKIIKAENSLKDDLYEMVALSSLMQNIFIFQRQCLKFIEENITPLRGQVWEILQYLQINFPRDIDSAWVAKKFDIKVAKLNSSLRALTGENFSQNLQRCRIRNACAMMAFKDLSIQYIGNYVGFSTPAAFYRAFKKIRGVTPQQYREKHSSEITNGIYDISYSIILYIFNHYNEQINSQTASETLFLTPAKIESIMEESFNRTFYDMLNIVRILYASSLLSATSLSVSDIAYSVGFTSLRTFTRRFHDETGTSATAYRKSQE